MSHLVLWLVLGVGLSSAANLRSLPDKMTDVELTDHARRIARAVNAEGYDIATLHGTSLFSGDKTRLTKRDVEEHAAHPSTESRNFELRLTSGERLRMSVQKRSGMSPDVTVVERVSGKEKVSRPQVRDCFFSGGLEGEEGHASLSLCDGQVMGGIRAGNRDYEVHPLPETSAIRRRSADEPLHAVVTWSDQGNDLMAFDSISPDLSDEDETEASDIIEETKPDSYKSATIEVGVYMDRFFLARVEERFGLTTTEQLMELAALKWSGINAVLSNPKVVGWNITIKVVHLEIWRESPSWYNESNFYLGGRQNMLCASTTDMPFDHIMLETADTRPNRIKGISWMDRMCNPRWRCSAARGAGFSNWIEAHETGHSMGLNHDWTFKSCDPNVPKGFMSMQETVFRDCYSQVLDRSLSSKGCLFKQNVDISKYNSVNNIVPLYRGQKATLDDQCRLNKGDGFEYLHIPSADVSVWHDFLDYFKIQYANAMKILVSVKDEMGFL
ncbi:A disintegrin and metalloproteinase with thrombospondin motifs adt-2-like [Pomacea canaliculata]|uniref:A disintegrin and metalloproteinase with thrombospondin motifs adt-2-like n=1 Tax=Pomacea canaliculata TaxID=400727 RepID=UPI000D73A048|nr:A disintegrin and metalloproteinase with thrombospondin motifs adt-2-like [Pomacea canaliculata]